LKLERLKQINNHIASYKNNENMHAFLQGLTLTILRQAMYERFFSWLCRKAKDTANAGTPTGSSSQMVAKWSYLDQPVSTIPEKPSLNMDE
jgi:hypothetical protein